MRMPEPSLDRMLEKFETDHDDGTGWTRHLREAIAAAPVLRENLERAVREQHLFGFALSHPSAPENNAYSPSDGTMLLNEETIRAARPGSPHVGELVFALGHETDHALRRIENAASRKAFHDVANRIVQTFDVPYHDYTAPLRDMLEARRTDEAKAHLAGYSAHHSWVVANNPHASLDDIHASLPGRMDDFIVVHPAGDSTYCALKPGLENENFFSHDLGQSESNVEAMKRYYYDKAATEARLGPNRNLDYRHHDAAQFMDLIDENDRFIHRRGTDVRNAGAPRVVVDLDALGLDAARLETRLPYITPSALLQDIPAETSGRGTKRTFERPQPGQDGTRPTDPVATKRARTTPGEDLASPEPAAGALPGTDHPLYREAYAQLWLQRRALSLDGDDTALQNIAAGMAFKARSDGWSNILNVSCKEDGSRVFALNQLIPNELAKRVNIEVADWKTRPAGDTLAKLVALDALPTETPLSHHRGPGGL